MAPDREADPLHDVVGVAGAADGVAVGAADGFGALQGFRVVAEKVCFGGDGEVFEEGSFGGEDGDDFGAQVVVAEGGLNGGAVEAAGAVDQGFFPEGFAAEAVGEVEPGGGVGGDGAVEDLAEGEEGGFYGAGDEGGLGSVRMCVSGSMICESWHDLRIRGSRLPLGLYLQFQGCRRYHPAHCRRRRCCGCRRLRGLAPMPVKVSLDVSKAMAGI